MEPFRKLCLALLALSVLASSEAFAGPQDRPSMPGAPCGAAAPCNQRGPHFGPGPNHGPKPFIETLTEEQRAKYFGIIEEYEPKLREYADQLFVKKNELQALTHAVQPDVQAVRATAQDIVDIRNARRALLRTIDARIEKECGIKRPRRMPDFDLFPHHAHHGPHRGFQGEPCGPMDR